MQSVSPRGVPPWLLEGLAVAFEPDGEAWTAAQRALDRGGAASIGALLQEIARGVPLATAF